MFVLPGGEDINKMHKPSDPEDKQRSPSIDTKVLISAL